MEKYNIYFDEKNPNGIMIRDKETNRIISVIACPPISSGCDIIHFGDKKINEGYTYDFGGLIIITTPEKREIYHKGILIAETKR
jgi:hypothetical protein